MNRWLAVAAPVALAAALPTAYADGPPVAHTGGFGEPTCARCHFDRQLNAPGGTLAIEGLPERYEPGRDYNLTVTLARRGLERGGMQLAVRVMDGPSRATQAGAVRPLDERSQVLPGPDGVAYLSHTLEGSLAAVPDTLMWRMVWTAPIDGDADVALHVAANASNDDASEFGDWIYTGERRTGAR
ncbi:MAG: hypothetical protein PVF27_03065 [Gemmatimonadales bacterium]|jgi:hypothetical protein